MRSKLDRLGWCGPPQARWYEQEREHGHRYTPALLQGETFERSSRGLVWPAHLPTGRNLNGDHCSQGLAAIINCTLCETFCGEKRESSLLPKVVTVLETDQDSWRAKEERQEGCRDCAIEGKSSKTRKDDSKLWKRVPGSIVLFPSPLVVSTKGTVDDVFGSTPHTNIWNTPESVFPAEGSIHGDSRGLYTLLFQNATIDGMVKAHALGRNRATLHSRVLYTQSL